MQNISVKDLSVDYSTTDETALAKSDTRAKQLLDEFGCFLAKGLIANEELDPVRSDIRRLVELKMQQLGLQKQAPADGVAHFDDGFLELSQLDRMHGQVVSNACRMLLSIHQINVNPKLASLSKKLLSTNTVMTHMHFDMRVDKPHEDERLFPWHQDYPVIQDSEDALVYWIPLEDVGEQNGCLSIAPGSHKLGVLPQFARSEYDPPSVEIIDWSILSRFPRLRVPVQVGDVLVFNTLMLHASGANRSESSRWTLQIRHGNFEHPKAVARNWPGSTTPRVPFAQTHPEYVIPSPYSQDAASRETVSRDKADSLPQPGQLMPPPINYPSSSKGPFAQVRPEYAIPLPQPENSRPVGPRS